MKKLFIALLICLFATTAYAAQRVVLVNGSGNEVTSGTTVATTEASASDIKTSVQIMDDWDSSDNCKVMINSRATGTATPVSAVTLDDDPTNYTSAAVNISTYQRVGFFWTYDETEVGGGVEVAMTITVSPDGTNYFSAPFFDTAGGATPQTSEVLNADGSYVCWLDKNIPFQYVKVTLTGTAVDADDTALNSVYMYMDK